MKPSPLKDKRILSIKTTDYDGDMIEVNLPSDEDIFMGKDVAAAVAWLKREIRTSAILHGDNKFVLERIDAAFPDLEVKDEA